MVTEYSGECIGHGHSKTVFKFHCQGETFHGCILKVRKAERDLDPSVFTRVGDYGITTNILYQARGIECIARPGQQISSIYHCWITERTVPLDEFMQWSCAVKPTCTLAAFCCTLLAAQRNLYLSDNHFFNFGVEITDDATEHNVVIIDVGSRGLDPDLQTISGVGREGRRTEYRIEDQMETSQRVQKHGRLCESSGVQQEGNGRLEVCCHFCTAKEHAIAVVSRLAHVSSKAYRAF